MRIREHQISATGKEKEDITNPNNSSIVGISKKLSVVVLDGMREVQAMKMPPNVKTCNDLTNEFNSKHEYTFSRYDEAHFVLRHTYIYE